MDRVPSIYRQGIPKNTSVYKLRFTNDRGTPEQETGTV